MSKGPGLFADIGKKAKGKESFRKLITNSLSLSLWSVYCFELIRLRNSHLKRFVLALVVDLLTKDYNSDQKFSVSTYSDAGVVRQFNIYTHIHTAKKKKTEYLEITGLDR
jgi:hypothetical protein